MLHIDGSAGIVPPEKEEEENMALLEDAVGGLLEGGAATGVAVGVGALLLVPGALPAVGRLVRPLAVAAIKTGMVVYDQATTTLKEATQDLVAEARAQIDQADGAEGDSGRRRARTAAAHG
jgi:hypothetical protein